MNASNVAIIAAIISAVASIIVAIATLTFRVFWERYFHIFKLEHEYRYQQRKRIKDKLAENKIRLINSCEELVYRLWNLSTNYSEGWQNSRNSYYFKSFVYRFLAVCAWVKRQKKIYST